MLKSLVLNAYESDNFDSVENLGILITAVKAAIVATTDRQLAQLGLTAVQYRVVKILALEKKATLASLCSLLDYDRGAMSRLLQRLESKELIVKKPSKKDKRSTFLSLSEKGQALLPELRAKVESVFEKTLGGFDSQEREQFSHFLIRCLNNLE